MVEGRDDEQHVAEIPMHLDACFQRSGTGRKRFRRVRIQTPSSVSFWALTKFRGDDSVSFVCQRELTKFFAELTEFAAGLSDSSLPKQYSRNSIPPVS